MTSAGGQVISKTRCSAAESVSTSCCKSRPAHCQLMTRCWL